MSEKTIVIRKYGIGDWLGDNEGCLESGLCIAGWLGVIVGVCSLAIVHWVCTLWILAGLTICLMAWWLLRLNKSMERKQLKSGVEIIPKDSLICIDGSNIIGLDDKLRTKVLEAVVNALRGHGYNCIVFVDKSIFGWLRHEMHDEAGAAYVAAGEKRGLIFVARNKTESVGQILQLAKFEKNVHILSTDKFREHVGSCSWLREEGAARRLHGTNIVPVDDGKFRILVSGFDLDIIVHG